MHDFDPIEWRESMRKKLCYLLISVLVIAAFTGCKQNETPQIAATEGTEHSITPTTEITENTTTKPTQNPTTEPTQNPTTGTTENTTSTETSTVNKKPQYLSEPYVYIKENGFDINHSIVSTFDWETIINKIPATYYEEYPELYGAPLTATLYKNGTSAELDINDPRLVRLINFYNNTMHHRLCSYTQGSFNSTDLEKLENNSFRLVLTYTPIAGSIETSYDTIIVNNNGFVGICHNNPFGSYPPYAYGRYPLHTDYNWLDVFGF